MSSGPRNLYQKIWDRHVVAQIDEKAVLIYIDFHLVHEVTSPQAFEGLRNAGRTVRAPHATLAVADHNVPTENRAGGVAAILDSGSRTQVETLERNAAEFGVPYIALTSQAQGIVHVTGPELGLTQPGMTIVCGDSHTSTHGAFAALAFGIGTSEVEHVLATQTLVQVPARTMLIRIDGELRNGVSAKDLALHVIGKIGTAGGTGYVVEYAGSTVEALQMSGRMTLCNMTIELGARAGLIGPDSTLIDFLRGRRFAPADDTFAAASADWLSLRSDEGAQYDKMETIDALLVAPMVTWGTSPEAVTTIDGVAPDPETIVDPSRRRETEQMLQYMGIVGGTSLAGLEIDVVFIGSCTNGRIEDLRDAARVVRGRHVATGKRALVVPGSGMVRSQAEAEGLDRIFVDAGFEWREPGCSMCVGMNPDRLLPGQRCASTSNRNFQGRQGPGGRTHLMSPAMAAAAAIAGHIVDVRSDLL